MKHRIRVACLVGAGVAVAAFAACSGTTEPSAEPDAAITPAPSAIPSPSTSTTAPPLTDAGDSGVLRDAVADSDVRDASDAADGADGYDGAPLPGSVETVADIPGLTDFDFVGDHLVYHNGGWGRNFKHCTLPACTDELGLGETGLVFGNSGDDGTSFWSVGDDERLHYTGFECPPGEACAGAYLSITSVLFDGTGKNVTPFIHSETCCGVSIEGLHGGAVGVVTIYQQWPCPGMPFCTRRSFAFGVGANTTRVARSSGLYHTNTGGAVVHYTPGSRPSAPPAPLAPATLDGVAAPVPATPPTLVAVSAAGPAVPHATVVVLRDGNVEACPLATPCLAWLNLGALGTILNLDDRHLYIGTPTGLSRCALAEIGTAGTCTLVPHGPVEAVEEPLYLTTTHAWYRSGTQVRRVLK